MKERKGFQFQLSKLERRDLKRLLSGGLQPVRTVLRALALLQLAEGQTIRKVAASVGLTPKTVWLVGQHYQQGGLERALYGQARPGKSSLLNGQQRQRNKIGLDVALEALRECRRERKCSVDELWHFARICRVANVMRPYLEATS